VVTEPLPGFETEAFCVQVERITSELHLVSLTVDDADAALEFFATAGGMRVVIDPTVLRGREIEDLLGLPQGASLRTAVVSDTENRAMRLEILEFTNVPVIAEKSRTSALRWVTFAVDDPAEVTAALEQAGGLRRNGGFLLGPGGVEIEIRDKRQG
jgi:hypothetical protein